MSTDHAKEKNIRVSTGWIYLFWTFLFLILSALSFVGLGVFADNPKMNAAVPLLIVAGVLFAILFFLFMSGFFNLAPNQAAVLSLFGDYRGSVRQAGILWVNPFYSKKKISLRSRNLNGEKLKVNDQIGNPIEIAAVIVWKVNDTFRASFDVENYDSFVKVQSESAVRHLANMYPYDFSEGESKTSLRGNTEEVAETLKQELQERVAKAGVEIEEARISHLAYAPEIAAAMLQRQQASAVIAARQMIVEGAVGMVEMAMEKLNEKGVVELDEERKAAMVSNLMVVLCAEKAASPIINAGTLYH
ncbi:MAG TPA: SPFH domain-containing protein [Clostridia bacterium]|nr:SPFH domain-containing protein [Clostridia bacterium]